VKSFGGLPSRAVALPPEQKAAVIAGLRYVIPKGAGIARRRAGHGFVYVFNGKVVKDETTLKRIRALVIPPAWKSVWISPDANSHIQAVGYDVKGRKQYRYHSDYRHVRDLVKFDRMRSFGRALPRIRRIVTRDLARPGLPKRKVLAAIVKLLETTYIRVGNEEYVKENESFGLTTLQNRHVQILGEVLRFHFRGKSGQKHEIALDDARLARVVRKCKCLPGSAVFQYLDEDGQPASVDSGDVNEYLRDISQGEFTAKDFRTWGGTCLALEYLLETGSVDTAKDLKTTLVDVVKSVAEKLGNKPATCRKYYIHPDVLDSFATGRLVTVAASLRRGESSYLYEKLLLTLLKPQKLAA
jgi:DNA topoisomerase-1